MRVVVVPRVVAACAAAPGAVPTTRRVAELGAVPGTLAFAEQYGYGWTTGVWQGQASPDQPEPDPNIQRQIAMDESEALAYGAALYGADPTDDWQTQGCEGRVGHEVTGEENATAVTDPALQAEIDTMWATIAEHPRQVALDSYWAQCMADSGNPGFTVPLDAENSILEAQAALNPDDADAVADLTAGEIALAVADYTCREDVSYADTQRQISIDVQQEFYDAHRAEVDSWLQAVQEARG